MNGKIKNILKILGIWFGITLVITFLYRCFSVDYDLGSPSEIFAYLIICSLGFFIVFLPTILALYFLFKKIKNQNFRILLTAFVIPFTNFIYYFIEYFFLSDSFTSYEIGFCTLFIILPLYFITVLCTPRAILPVKWGIIKTIILTAIFGVGLIILSNEIVLKISDITAKNKLDKYDVIINDIENYKKQNGIYPQKIDDNVQQFEQFYYNPINSGMDYILTVGDSYIRQYNYCSTEKLDGCHPQTTKYASYEKFGKWIEVVEFD